MIKDKFLNDQLFHEEVTCSACYIYCVVYLTILFLLLLVCFILTNCMASSLMEDHQIEIGDNYVPRMTLYQK